MEQPVNSSPPLEKGTQLGQYTVLARIGAGGMGEVYKARDTSLNRDVAIKVLSSSLSNDPDRLRRFEQEARAAAALNHPNILAVYHLGTYEGAPYLVSELLEGSTLREQLSRGPLPLRKVIDYAVQIARGLAAAHEKGIVHRDLKPENLFVAKDGRVKILDFGLAKVTERNWPLDSKAATVSRGTEPGVVMGTVGYMAPEQVSGKAADHRADIFAFGAVLYEMLTGKRAFQKPTSVETMSAILNEEPPAVSQLTPTSPPALQRVVQRCLEKDPEQRFQSASDLAFALDALSDSTAISAVAPPALPARKPRWKRATIGALIVLALLAGGSLVLFRSRESTSPAHLEYTQLTNFADSAVAPALSPDGRMLAFIRGNDTFIGEGQIYVKLLPDGEPVQLTHDNFSKMSPTFSPDGSSIAYTIETDTPFGWHTWIIPALGGEPHLMLPNAEVLSWIDDRNLLFSEIKTGLHMGVVTTTVNRGESRDVYLPARERGMAHRSALSPDHKWVLVAEMDNGGWLPCRLVPFDGSSAGSPVGPPGAACTYVAWSPDGAWMYFSSQAGGHFHIWREQFRHGQPRQLTSGATEEEGIAITPDGGSLITSVGLMQSTLWVRDASGERQITSEGYAEWPRVSPDGRKLYYLVRRRGGSLAWFEGDLWVADLGTNRSMHLLPQFDVTGYDVSPDGTKVVFSSADQQSHPRLWIAPLDLSSPPRQLPSSADEDQPCWGQEGRIYFRAVEGKANFLYRMKEDGSERTKVLSDPILEIHAASPDGKWVVVGQMHTQDATLETAARRVSDGSSVTICQGFCLTSWGGGGHTFNVIAQGTAGTETLVFPLAPGETLPSLPATGLRSGETLEGMSGAKVVPGTVLPGPTSALSVILRQEVHRNLYKVLLR